MIKYHKLNPLVGYIFEESETEHPFFETYKKISVKLDLVNMGTDFKMSLLEESAPIQYWLQTQKVKNISFISFDDFLTIIQVNKLTYSFRISNYDVKLSIAKRMNADNEEYNQSLPEGTLGGFFRKTDTEPNDFNFVIKAFNLKDVLNFVRGFEHGSSVTIDDIICLRYEMSGSFVTYNLTKDG